MAPSVPVLGACLCRVPVRQPTEKKELPNVRTHPGFPPVGESEASFLKTM